MSVSKSLNGDGDTGPFMGRQIGDALEYLGWQQRMRTAPDEVAEYRKDGIDNEIHLNPYKAMYCSGRPFELVATHMIDRAVSGRAKERAVANARTELLDAVREIAKRDRERRSSEAHPDSDLG